MKIYEGKRQNGHAVVEVTTDGETAVLTLTPSLKVRNHSPSGFEWGYCGSGPAQLALAILLHAYPERGEDWAAEWHQKFKAKVISKLSPDGWRLTGKAVAHAVSELEAAWAPGKFSREAPTTPERSTREVEAHARGVAKGRAILDALEAALPGAAVVSSEKLAAYEAAVDRVGRLELVLRQARAALLFEDEENAGARDEDAIKAIDEVLGDHWVDPREQNP